MTEAILAPTTDDETRLLWESELTPAEATRKMALEARASGCQREKARCLLHIHQECLFRGPNGHRSWGDYLAEEGAMLGYADMDTGKASLEMMWILLCDAIDEWNDKHPDKRLPLPKSRRWLDGWATLFDRARVAGAESWSKFGDRAADRAVKALYDGVQKKGEPTTKDAFVALGRAQRSTHGRPAIAAAGRPFSGSPARPAGPAPLARGTTPQPTVTIDEDQVVKRTVSPEDLEAAERARLKREYEAEQQRIREQEDYEQGIDPRALHVEEKPELNIVAEAETFATLCNKVSLSCQELEVWVRGKLNAYGSPFFDSMLEFALGINSAHGRLDQITAARDRLANVVQNLQEDLEPGCFTDPASFEAEPPLKRGA